jgi:phosphoribosylglycinamide formyltransferase-1
VFPYLCAKLLLVIKLAIFASGRATNARNIVETFQTDDQVQVKLLITNNFESGLIDVSREFHISSFYFDNEKVAEGENLLQRLRDFEIDYVILAGFLRKIPEVITQAYPKHIINIHPALLPKFGGKGMYGIKVHQAVLDAGEKETGITIHLVNEQYDEGQILAQYSLVIPDNCNARYLQTLVQELEHKHYPLAIEKYIKNV